MRTSDLGPALDGIDQAVDMAVEQFMQQSHPRLQKLAERIGLLAELDPDEPVSIPPQMIALRLVREVNRAVRAYLTLRVAESQAMGFRSAQIAAALGHASPSNVRAKYRTAEAELLLRHAYEESSAESVEVTVDGRRFRLALDDRFDGEESESE